MQEATFRARPGAIGNCTRPAAPPVLDRTAAWVSRLFLSPVALNTTIWTVVAVLYAFQLSYILIFPDWRVWSAVALIVGAFAGGALVSSVVPTRASVPDSPWRQRRTTRRLLLLVGLWAAGATAEVYFAGGLPLLWRLEGSGRSYIDFGVQSLGGLLISMLLAIGLVGFDQYLRARRVAFLLLAGLPLLWAVIAIERSVFMFVAVEYSILWVTTRPVTVRHLVRLGMIAGISLGVFGVAGNLRTGIETLIDAAQITPKAAEALPAPLLWGYAYLVTPVNNLLNTAALRPPAMRWDFPDTVSMLLPGFLRDQVVSDPRLAAFGVLMVPQMTVSTAYVSPYQDMGWLGVAAYASFWGFLSAYVRRCRSRMAALTYCVLAMCIVTSVFANYYLTLATIVQVVWIFCIFFALRSPHRGFDVGPLGVRRG